jgi:hypothetical protein
LWTWDDVEIACGDAPARVQDMASNGLERVPFPVALMRTVRGDEAHRGRIDGASSMPKVESNRHGFGVEVRRAASARLS